MKHTLLPYRILDALGDEGDNGDNGDDDDANGDKERTFFFFLLENKTKRKKITQNKRNMGRKIII